MVTVGFFLAVLFLFVVGAVVGSFLNVLVYRSAVGEDWKYGRSRCDHCRKLIAWYDNVPLLSFLMLRGKCRSCHKPIAVSHVVVELLTGLLFAWWYAFGFLFFQLTQAPYSVVQPLFWLLVGVILLIITVTDWRYYIIPDTAVIVLAVLSIGYRLILSMTGVMRWEDFWLTTLSAIGAAIFFFCLWFFTKGKGMGFGDVKLIGPLFFLMGWPRSLVGLFFAFLIGACVGVVLLALKKKKLRQPIPFGPFLIFGTVLSLLWGAELLHWYLQLLF